MKRASRRRVAAVRPGEVPRIREDVLAIEEPLEIRVGGASFSVTMRTPGDDFDLVAGFLVSEGVVARDEDLPDDAGRDAASPGPASRPSTSSTRRCRAAGSPLARRAGADHLHDELVRGVRARLASTR